MRNTTSWYSPLRQELSSNLLGMDLYDFCCAEIGLFGLPTLFGEQAPARILWTLLRGYNFLNIFPETDSATWRQAYLNVRAILISYRNRYDWENLLHRYRQVDESYRLFRLEADLADFAVRDVSIARERLDIYARTLE